MLRSLQKLKDLACKYTYSTDESIENQTAIVKEIEKLLKSEAKKLDDYLKQKMELENGNR